MRFPLQVFKGKTGCGFLEITTPRQVQYRQSRSSKTGGNGAGVSLHSNWIKDSNGNLVKSQQKWTIHSWCGTFLPVPHISFDNCTNGVGGGTFIVALLHIVEIKARLAAN